MQGQLEELLQMAEQRDASMVEEEAGGSEGGAGREL